MSNKLGIYIHIPFCASKCSYCDFYSMVLSEQTRSQYLERLKEQILQWKNKCTGEEVDTVYIGGGTPSLLTAGQIQDLMNTLYQNFNIQRDSEITVEANPDSADKQWLEGVHRAGVNRISLGIQSSENRILKRIGRRHTYEQAVQAFLRAREAGFSNISVDLIYGLPEETWESLIQSLNDVMQLRPEHISCYGLKIEEETPLFQRYRTDPEIFPDGDQQAERYLEICRTLKRHGWEQYEISNFSLPGRESRHNLKYWNLNPYLGFGPGAHSDFHEVRFSWKKDLAAYLKGDFQVGEYQEITEKERLQEKILLGLRLKTGIPAEKVPAKLSSKLCGEGYAEIFGERFSLTPKGFMVSNSIILEVLKELE